MIHCIIYPEAPVKIIALGSDLPAIKQVGHCEKQWIEGA